MPHQAWTTHLANQPPLRYAGRLLLLALAYFACGRLGLAIPYVGTHITLIWLPTGIAVAALLRWGYRCWPGILLGALLTNFTLDAHLLLAGNIALGNTLAPLLTVWLLRRVKFHSVLDRARDILLLTGVAALGMLVSSGIGVNSLWLFAGLPRPETTAAWLSWWAGDTVGVLLAAPLLLNVTRQRLIALWAQRVEFLLWGSAMVTMSWLVFFLNNDALGYSQPLVFVMFPLIVWSAMRFGVLGSSLGVLLPVLMAGWATAGGLGPFHPEGEHYGFFLLLLYAATLVLINLLVVALQAERHRDQVRLKSLTQLYAAMNKSNQAIARCHNQAELFPQICQEVVQSGGMKMAWIGLLDEASQMIVPAAAFGSGIAYLEGIEISASADKASGRGPAGIAMREDRPYWCQDYMNDTLLGLWRERGAKSGWASGAALPLHHQGKIVGVLTLYSGELNAFDEATCNLLVEMATDVDYALNKYTLEEVSRIAAVTFETQEAILITDAHASILRINQAFQDITGYVAEEVLGRNPRMFQSGRHDKAFYQAMWSELLETGKWSGEVWDRRKSGDIYPKSITITAVYDAQHQVTHYVAVFRDISRRKQSEQDIHQLAYYDPLTHLPNRLMLMERLNQAMATSMRNEQQGALLFMDLDHFKTINDTQGHAVGDLLLIEVAHRLQACVRESDSVARLGGDEFVVLIGALSRQLDDAVSQAEIIAEKIRIELGKPYLLKDYACLSTPSIGISLFHGHQESVEELLKHADVAMYQAKTSGRNTIRFFDPRMQESLDKRLAMETDLRLALARQQFQLHYQIQVDSLQRPLGAEALLRWQHPERGFVFPDQFIPLAEETGLIVPIGLWVLQTACTQLKIWQSDALTRDLTLAVNVSARQFRQPDFVSLVQRALLESGAKPALLKLELTESTVLENVDDTIAKMREIKMLGVSFSMDDFGTGYSSLQYLKRLPLDQIKIDKSFVMDITTDPNDAAIVQTIIAMTQALGLNVIAEGVETEAQLEFLDVRGCHAFQGYLFSKPVPVAAFEALLKRD